jgi:hypothetical protein
VDVQDERAERTPEEEAALLIARKKAEAEADLVDERVKMAVVGSGVVGIASVFIMILAAFRDNTGMLIAAGTIALVSFGVVTAAQAGLLFGRAP